MNEAQKIRMRWTGVSDMLMHRMPLPNDPILAEKESLSGKKDKDKTADDRELQRWCDWRSSIYWDETLGIYVPSDNIERCLKDGAQKIKKGKQVEAGSFVSVSRIPVTGLKYPKDIKAIYADDRFHFGKMVRIPPRTGARVWFEGVKVPMGWILEFDLEFDGGSVDPETLLKSAQQAGRIVAIGRWRPKYGRFIAEVIS